MLFVQNSLKETHLHENKHDERHRYVEMLSQDNDNQNKKNYILREHIERNENPTYEHDMDIKKENTDTQKYLESYNQEYDETYTQTKIFFGEQK